MKTTVVAAALCLGLVSQPVAWGQGPFVGLYGPIFGPLPLRRFLARSYCGFERMVDGSMIEHPALEAFTVTSVFSSLAAGARH